MNLESSLTCIALVSLAVACSGSTQIGESGTGGGGDSSGSVSSGGVGSSAGGIGNAATGNATTNTSGTTAGSGGGAGAGGSTATSGGGGSVGSTTGGSGGDETNPCQGKPCGASCSDCVGDMNCESETGDMFCDDQGQCVTQYPACETDECQTAMDCTQLGAPCEQCADGSLACPFVDCIAGECVGSFPTCQASCTTDADCPVSVGACQLCEDGTAACPWSECREGTCVSGIDGCGDADPCEGKQCGDTCGACDSADPSCNNVLMYCDEELRCQPNQPMCSALTCDSDSDCPLLDACPPCADGTTCAELKCVNGTCNFQCPDDGACGAAGDSCAGGSACCSGLTCCAGVPVPEGEEYCSASDCPDSDVNLKRDFAAVDPDLILERLVELPIASWSYRAESPSVKHIGPMAQDFMAAFEVGASDRAIAKVDADGVAFAAIQALHARLQALEARNARLERELSNRSDCRSSDASVPR